MLELTDLTCWYHEDSRPSIGGITWACPRGRISEVRGDNGSGKTTLALAVAGIIPDIVGGRIEGRIRFEGGDTTGEQLRAVSAMAFDTPMLSFAGRTIGEECLFLRESGPEFLHVAEDSLGVDAASRPLSSLSAGQQQYLAVLSALLQDRRIVFLDEPFMFLDRRATSAVVDAIQRVREKKVVFVLHGLDSESSMADSATLWLSSGAMLSTAPCQECAASPPPAETVSEDTLLAVESLHYSYPHATEPTLVNVSVSVQRGEAVCITGANGAGKTTLLLLLAGLLRPNRGRVYLHGSVAKRRHLRRNVRVAFQQPDAQIFLRTAEEELTFGPRCSGVARDVALLNMRSTASMLPFRLDVDPMSLSFGQRKLLTIACALAAKPPLVALDEPLAGLDSHARRCVREMLGTFLRSGGAAVVTSSHGDRELSLCHRGIRLQSSRDNGE